MARESDKVVVRQKAEKQDAEEPERALRCFQNTPRLKFGWPSSLLCWMGVYRWPRVTRRALLNSSTGCVMVHSHMCGVRPDSRHSQPRNSPGIGRLQQGSASSATCILILSIVRPVTSGHKTAKKQLCLTHHSCRTASGDVPKVDRASLQKLRSHPSHRQHNISRANPQPLSRPAHRRLSWHPIT